MKILSSRILSNSNADILPQPFNNYFSSIFGSLDFARRTMRYHFGGTIKRLSVSANFRELTAPRVVTSGRPPAAMLSSQHAFDRADFGFLRMRDRVHEEISLLTPERLVNVDEFEKRGRT